MLITTVTIQIDIITPLMKIIRRRRENNTIHNRDDENNDIHTGNLPEIKAIEMVILPFFPLLLAMQIRRRLVIALLITSARVIETKFTHIMIKVSISDITIDIFLVNIIAIAYPYFIITIITIPIMVKVGI